MCENNTKELSMWTWRIPRLTCSPSHVEDANTSTWDKLKYRKSGKLVEKAMLATQSFLNPFDVPVQRKESCIASLPEHQLLLQLRKRWWQQSQLGKKGFIKERLYTKERSFDLVKKLNLKKFQCGDKKVKVKTAENKIIITKQHRCVAIQLLVKSQTHG